MFDPTVFDNLKVVLEGTLYDYDRDKRLFVFGRQDNVDLASMSRTFVLHANLPEGLCMAEVKMYALMPDFAAELWHVRLVGELPGCRLLISLFLNEEASLFHSVIDEYLQEMWGDVADFAHRRSTLLAGGGELEKGNYEIQIRFRNKIDEGNIEDIEPLISHLEQTLKYLDEKGNSF